jgi:hypothetical protein
MVHFVVINYMGEETQTESIVQVFDTHCAVGYLHVCWDRYDIDSGGASEPSSEH